MTKTDKLFLAALTCFAPFGPKRLGKIEGSLPSWQAAFEAGGRRLIEVGLEERIVDDFLSWRKDFDLERFQSTLNKEGIETLSLKEDAYPKRLAQTYDPPPLLFYRGSLKKEESLLAVVGSRKCTPYGEKIVATIIPPLVLAGLGISSGLALGIDTLAHAATLEAGGRTLAVLGCGIDRASIYPPQNRLLAEKVVEGGGCLLSEFPPLTAPLKQNFPRRNRIISGLSQGVLVVEAGEKSGSLITARFALEEGREVFASPGSVFSWQSQGPNKLIKEGAHPVTDSADILEALGLKNDHKEGDKAKTDWSGMSEKERIILVNLSSVPTDIDDLARRSRLDIKIINSTLTILEIKGLAKNIGGGNYILL
jgi:DNA processing protein